MTWYAWLFIGYSICSTIVIALILPKIGNDYTIENNIKNRKGLVKDNNLTSDNNINEPKRKLKRRNKNGKE